MRHLHIKAIFVFLLANITSSLFSQEFQGGVMIGITGSQIDGDTYSGYNKAGLEVGVYVKREFSERYSWQMELKYIGKGAAANNFNAKVSDPYKVALHYIELPVLFQYRISTKLSGELGPAYAYLLASGNDFDGWGMREPYPPFNKSDISALAGFAYKLNEKWLLNVRISYSILVIRGTSELSTDLYRSGQYNNLLCFGVYYRIR